MKFGKEFMSQMVPEWQEAYMDYNYLKSLVKEIAKFKLRTTPVQSVSSSNVGLKRRVSLYRAFSGLTKKKNPKEDEEDQVILVNAVQEEGSSSEGCYQTLFLMSDEDDGQYERVFFKRLDDEFNKVIKFYKSKVQEVMNEAEDINKQMDALIALRLKVDIPAALGLRRDPPPPPPPPMHPATNTGNRSSSGIAHMEVIHEVEMSSDQSSENKSTGLRNMNNDGSRPAPLEVLDHVKINVKLETPWSTLKSVLMHSRSNDLTFTNDELREVEEQLKQVLVGFHQKLRLLKSYSFLNILAFSKIMKKYDKVSSRHASKAYLKMVDNSDIGSSDEVTRLMERVEATFIKHFSNANRRKGIRALKPQIKRERHRVTFFLGLFVGCSIALVVAIAVLIQARTIFMSKGSWREARENYMSNIFPLYSLFIFIVLHMIMYSADVFFWRRYRVNYPFIFGFKQGTELGYRQVFLVSAGIAVLAFAGVLSNLDMDTVLSDLDMDKEPKTKKFRTLTELLPLGLVLVLLTITLCPFNIIYRSSRFFLLGCLGHCILAPLYKVTLPDFFLADQLTSQVQAIRSLQFYFCYYATGDFRKETNKSNSCRESNVYDAFYLGVAVIPYWFRLAQCLRRLFEEKDAMQGWNGLKYFSTIVSVVMRTVYEQMKRKIDEQMIRKVTIEQRRIKLMNTWKFMAGGSSAVATLANLYWDLVIDWGLLNWNSRNFLLRDKLLVPHKSVYFVAMVLDVILRLAWLQSILGFPGVSFLHNNALVATVACLEIIRRGIWNFFRLENEHLNNVGKYRAFKTVPLPFNYDDEDKDG